MGMPDYLYDMQIAATFANSIDASAFIFQAAFQDRKFEVSDMTDDLYQAARFIALAWSNTPQHWANNFMLDMRQRAGSKKGMNPAQAKGVLNVIRAEQMKALESLKVQVNAPVGGEPAAPALNLSKLKTVRYRVVQPDDSSISIRLSIPTMWTDAPKGTRKLSAMVSGKWEAIGKVDPDGTVHIWKKAGQSLTERVTTALTTLVNADDDLVYILAYAMIGSECGFCGLQLDTAESLSVGYGKTCAKNHGLPWGAKAVPAKVLLAKAFAAGKTGVPQQPAEIQHMADNMAIYDDTDAAAPFVDGTGAILRTVNLADELAALADMANDAAAGN